VAKFIHLETAAINQICIHKEIKIRLNSGNICYLSVQNLPSPLQIVSNGCETWSVTLNEEHGLRLFENRVLGRIFGSKREEVGGGWRRLHDEEFHNLYASSNIIMVIKSRRITGRGM